MYRRREVFTIYTGYDGADQNVNDLDSKGISYIIPLRRNSKLIDYSTVKVRLFFPIFGG